MTRHELKTWPEYWREVAAGRKTCELRQNDRGFRVGDVLVLREFDDEAYTGNVCTRTVTHVFDGGRFGLDHSFVCLSLGPEPEEACDVERV